jgi:hypothetical protein
VELLLLFKPFFTQSDANKWQVNQVINARALELVKSQHPRDHSLQLVAVPFWDSIKLAIFDFDG